MLKKIIFVFVLVTSANLYSKEINHIATAKDGKIEAVGVSISADDNFVYVSAGGNVCCKNNLVTFKRDIEDGSLEVVQTDPDAFSGMRVYEQLLSKDQEYIYAAGYGISVLSRNLDTGMLSEIQNISGSELPESSTGVRRKLAESHDGKYILVSGGGINISVFKPVEGTGELEFVYLWENELDIPLGYEIRDLEFMPGSNLFYISSPTGIAVFRLNELNGEITYLWSENGFSNEALSTIQASYEIAFNHTNNDVYLASRSGLNVFSSDLESGQLALKQFIEIEALDYSMVLPRKLNVNNGMLYMVVGEDANFGSFEKNGVIQFSINSESGELATVDSIFNGVDIDLMHGPMDIVFSTDSKSAYLPVFVNGVLLQFDSNSENGELTYQSYTNATNGVRGLESPRDVDVSADGKFLYFTDGFSGVASFEFNPQNESLNFIESVSPYSQHNGSFGNGIISPDGKHFYLVEENDSSIHLFDRSEESGKLTFSQTFSSSNTSWIDRYQALSSLEIGANGEYAYVTHSNSNWLVTILARNPENGALTLVERIQNNIYGNTNGIGEFFGAVYSKILPDGKHILVYSNNGQLALLAIDELAGTLELAQLMENELFDEPNSRITTSEIGLNGNLMYLPYQTSNESSSVIDEGIIVSEFDAATDNLIVKHKYSSQNESYGWLEGRIDFKLNSVGDKAYITKDYGNSFITVNVDITTGALSLLEEVTPEELGLPSVGQPFLANTFQNDRYIVSIDGFNGEIDLFRKNTAPEFIGTIQNYEVNVRQYLKIDFAALFTDADNDDLEYEVSGSIPDWLTVNPTSISGTPAETDSDAVFTLSAFDGVNTTEINITFKIERPIAATESSGGGAIFWPFLLILFVLTIRRSPYLIKQY